MTLTLWRLTTLRRQLYSGPAAIAIRGRHAGALSRSFRSNVRSLECSSKQALSMESVECMNPRLKDDMDQFLSAHYRFVEDFTYRDFLYASRDRT